jgi:hypothetical protein
LGVEDYDEYEYMQTCHGGDCKCIMDYFVPSYLVDANSVGDANDHIEEFCDEANLKFCPDCKSTLKCEYEDLLPDTLIE